MAQVPPLTIVSNKNGAKYVVLKPLIAAACLCHPPTRPPSELGISRELVTELTEWAFECLPAFLPLSLISVFVGLVLICCYFSCFLVSTCKQSARKSQQDVSSRGSSEHFLYIWCLVWQRFHKFGLDRREKCWFCKEAFGITNTCNFLRLSQSYCYSELNTNHDDTNMVGRQHCAYFFIHLDSVW